MSTTVDPSRLRAAYETVRRDLLDERSPDGHWLGELSSSALSTATAVSALAMVDHAGAVRRYYELVARGIRRLVATQRPDGGWGDTDLNRSNVATTMLVEAAVHLAGPREHHGTLCRARGYIAAAGGIEGLKRRYGKDKTFAAPILTNCALAGLVPWSAVPQLPFELAALPQALYRFVRLPVVSYAIPALVAIGQARHHHRPTRNPLARLARRIAIEPSLRVLEAMQPDGGGFLEATPLTSFVVMSLASIDRADHPVARQGVEFLIRSARADGSWPIDTNLATWNTTLAINALAEAGEQIGELGCLEWLLACRHRSRHPYTGAAPGGWAWTDLPGGVPDADDTAGALLALAAWRRASPHNAARIDPIAEEAIGWLVGLANRDGGWPTFCRGWGTLPFDKSGADLTAHAIRGLHAWIDLPPAATRRAAIQRAIERGFAFLSERQRADGSWVPLWFGNQYAPGEENPVYGTARVLLAYRDLQRLANEPARRGLAWLCTAVNPDGGLGGGVGLDNPESSPVRSSVEETALAVEALLAAEWDPKCRAAADSGLAWLIDAVEANRHRECSPIGLYFAKLWYEERLYPLIFSAAALGGAARAIADRAAIERDTQYSARA